MRRLFWLGVGAGLGITGYRKATRLARELTHPFTATRPRWRLGALPAFARDVREGMAEYAQQQRRDIGPRQVPEGPTLGWHQVSAHEAGRNGLSAR